MTEKQKPGFKMWFHKFMIYFAIWAFAVFVVLYGVKGIAEAIENNMPHTALFVIAWGALIALALFLVKVRFDLPSEQERQGYSTVTRAVQKGDKLEALGWQPRVALEEGLRRTLSIKREGLR